MVEEMSIQLTLTTDEIEQLEKATRYEIVDKEDLHSAVLMAIEKYVESYEKDSLYHAHIESQKRLENYYRCSLKDIAKQLGHNPQRMTEVWVSKADEV